MSNPKLNQPLKLSDTFTINGAAITGPLTAAYYDYWKPSNNTVTPSGQWTATILDANAGTVEYDIPANTLDESTNVNTKWKTQLNGTIGGLVFPADPYCFDVDYRGKC